MKSWLVQLEKELDFEILKNSLKSEVQKKFNALGLYCALFYLFLSPSPSLSLSLHIYRVFFSLFTLSSYRLSFLSHHSRLVVGNSQTEFFLLQYFYIWFLMFFLHVFMSDKESWMESWINMLHTAHFLNWLMPLHSDNVVKGSPSP